MRIRVRLLLLFAVLSLFGNGVATGAGLLTLRQASNESDQKRQHADDGKYRHRFQEDRSAVLHGSAALAMLTQQLFGASAQAFARRLLQQFAERAALGK